MGALRHVVMWLPGLAAIAFVLADAGPLPALAVAAVGLLSARHWILVAAVVVPAYLFGDVSLLGLLLASVYRLIFAEPIGLLMRKWSGDGGQATSRQHRPTPVVFCRHGARAICRTGDRAMRRGDPRTALDCYLRALVTHPGTGLCARILELRAAEASYAVGAARIASVLGSAALTGMSETPFFRQAVVAARGYAVCALAASALDETDEAMRLLRLAQAVAHRNRSADRFVRLSAVVVRLSLRDATTDDMSTQVLTSELAGQSMTKVTSYEMAWVAARWARTLARRGRHDLASVMYRQTIGIVEDNGSGTSLDSLLARPGGVRRSRHVAILLVDGSCGLLETTKRLDPSAEDRLADRASEASQVVTQLGDDFLAARLSAAVFGRYGGTEARADGLARFDSAPQFIGDDRLQAEWIAVRGALSRPLPGTPVDPVPVAPWPWHPEALVALRGAATTAVGLFDELSRNVPALAPVREHARKTASALRNGPAATRLAVPLEALMTALPPVEATSEEAVTHDFPPEVAVRADREVICEPDVPSEDTRPTPPVPPAVAPPAWLAAADLLAEGYCATARDAWLLAVELGHRFVGVEHLVLAALADPECAEAWEAATPHSARDAVDRVLGRGFASPVGFTAAAEDVITDAATVARQTGTTLVRPWHVVLAALSAPSSVITDDGAVVDEIAVRLVCGAVNLRTESSSPRLMGFATSAFSPVARVVSEHALSLVPEFGTITGEEILVAVTKCVLAPPSLRARAEARHTGASPGRRGPARLDSALHRLDRAAKQWSRGVDLADLVDLAEGKSPWGAAHAPSVATTAILLDAAEHARLRGGTFLGVEHVLLAFTTRIDHDHVAGPKPVCTPTVKRLLDVACGESGGAVVEPGHLRAALASRDQQPC